MESNADDNVEILAGHNIYYIGDTSAHTFTKSSQYFKGFRVAGTPGTAVIASIKSENGTELVTKMNIGSVTMTVSDRDFSFGCWANSIQLTSGAVYLLR